MSFKVIAHCGELKIESDIDKPRLKATLRSFPEKGGVLKYNLNLCV